MGSLILPNWYLFLLQIRSFLLQNGYVLFGCFSPFFYKMDTFYKMGSSFKNYKMGTSYKRFVYYKIVPNNCLKTF